MNGLLLILRSLRDKGLLELVRNRGFRVVELTDQDKQEVYDLRLLVDPEQPGPSDEDTAASGAAPP